MRKLALAAALALAASAQAKTFEGTVKYQTTVEGKAGHVVRMSISGAKMRTEAEDLGKGAAILDFKAKTMTLLMADKKKYMVQDLKTPAPAEAAKVKATIKKTGRSERIAGYLAEEYGVDSEGRHSAFWGSAELGGWGADLQGAQAQGGDIEVPSELREQGVFPLRVVTGGPGKVRKMEAVEVKPGSVDPALFAPPAGYTEMKAPAAGPGAKGMSPEQSEKMRKAMEKLTPEQRAMMEKMMKMQGR